MRPLPGTAETGRRARRGVFWSFHVYWSKRWALRQRRISGFGVEVVVSRAESIPDRAGLWTSLVGWCGYMPGRCPGLVWVGPLTLARGVVRIFRRAKGPPLYQPGATPQETVQKKSKKGQRPAPLLLSHAADPHEITNFVF